jgi:DNA-binding MltR family transcriptional regulator
MAKRLKKFLQFGPSPEEKDQVAQEVLTDGPRGAVMVAIAFLDDYLIKLIRRRFVALTEDEQESLFAPDRPLGSFSSRIKVAYALGIYGRKTSHDLNILRDIRNVFAHGLRKMDFETPEVKELISSLHCIKDIEKYDILSSREAFFEITAVLLSHLSLKVSRREHRLPEKHSLVFPHLD